MKMQEYSLEDIFAKGLLMLIPFYIFSHEKQFMVYNNEQKLEELKAKYQGILGRLVAKTITKQDAAKLKEQGWKFDWSIPHRNGYEVYELLVEDDNVVQGRIALKHVRDQFYTHVDIVEAAPFNVGREGKY